MNKNDLINTNEIDLFRIIKILWSGKWIIIGTTLLGVVISLFLHFNKNNVFEIFTQIKIDKLVPIADFLTINEILLENQLYYSDSTRIDSSIIFELLDTEFNDYEEIVSVLENSEFFLNKGKDLDNSEKLNLFSSYSKNFNMDPAVDGKTFNVSIIWHDANEGEEIFKNALKMTLENVKNSLLYDIEELASFLEVKIKRKVDFYKSRLLLLEEQIDILENLSSDQQLKFPTEYFILKERVVLLENDLSVFLLRSSINNISEINPFIWISYDFNLSNMKSKVNYSLYYLIIFLGLCIGMLYVILSKFSNILKINYNTLIDKK